MSHKKKNVEYLADFSIGTMLGDNPTQQEIEELLEEKRADLKEKSEEIRRNPKYSELSAAPSKPRKAKRMRVYTTHTLFFSRDPVGITERRVDY